jgi:hypothetical protein
MASSTLSNSMQGLYYLLFSEVLSNITNSKFFNRKLKTRIEICEKYCILLLSLVLIVILAVGNIK